MFLESMKAECAFLESTIAKAQNDIKTAPPGSLRIMRANKTPAFYHRKEKSDRYGSYIKASDRKVAQELAQKEYAQKITKNTEIRIDLLKKLIKEYEDKDILRIYDSYNKARKKLIVPYSITDEEYAEQWLNTSYESNQVHPENLIFETANGETVRSKSELIIADNLLRLKIPYKYEAPFICSNGSVIYPDFTALNIKTRRLVYCEHFGILDDENYRESFFWKIKTYSKNGVIQGENLILTFEDLNHPFDFSSYKRTFEKMLLEG